jgi:hypothetical protein
MKKYTLMLMVPLIILGITVSSCKKKTQEPDYPQLIGSWKGMTDQSIPIQIHVDNIGGTLYVTNVMLEFSGGPGDTTTLSRYNSEGLSALSGTSFSVVLDGTPPRQSLVTGIFRLDSLSLSGNFTGYADLTSASPVTGTYTAGKSQ